MLTGFKRVHKQNCYTSQIVKWQSVQLALYAALHNYVGEKRRPGMQYTAHVPNFKQYLVNPCCYYVTKTVWLIEHQLSPTKVPSFTEYVSYTLEILLMTNITLKAEHISAMDAGNDCFVCLPTGYSKSLCHWFCNHLRMNRLVGCPL